MEGYYMTLKTGGIFFRYCRRYNIESRADKMALLERLSKKHKAMYTENVELFHKSLKDKGN